MTCKNCGHTVSDNYCSKCGQSTKISRITFKSVLSQITESIFQINHGFLFTMKTLFLKPGESIKDYLHGKRVRFFKPMAYVLTLSTIYLLATKILGGNTWMDDLITGFTDGLTEHESEHSESVPGFLIWMANNFAYASLILLPFFSLSSFLAFKKFTYNYTEHLIMNAFLSGQKSIILLIGAIAYHYLRIDYLETLPLGIGLCYTFFAYWKVFSDGNRFMIVLRTILTYLLYAVMFAILFILAMISHKILNWFIWFVLNGYLWVKSINDIMIQMNLPPFS